MSMLILPQGRGAANIDCGNAVPHTLWRADLGVPGVDALTGRPCSQRHGTYRIQQQIRDIGITTTSDTGGTTQACGVSIPATGDFGAIVGCSIFWVGAVTAYSADNNLYSRIVSTSLHNGNYGGGFRAGLSNSQTPFIRLHLNGAWETVYSTTFVPYSKLTTIVIDIVADGVVFWVNGVAEHVTTTAAPLQTVGVNLRTCSANIGATANEYTGHRYAKCIAAGIFTGGLPEHVKRDGREMLNPRDDIIWLDAGGGGVTGSFAATESGSDTAAFSGAILVSGGFAATEASGDAAALVGQVHAAGTLAASESGADTAAFLGSGAAPPIYGAFDILESGADGFALSGDIIVAGGLTASESGGDVAAFAVGGGISGTLAASETGTDSAAFSGAILVSGGFASTEAGVDAATATGKVVVSGSLTATESGSDTANIFGGSLVSGTISAIESGSDICSISGVLPGALVSDPVFILTHTARNLTLSHTARTFRI